MNIIQIWRRGPSCEFRGWELLLLWVTQSKGPSRQHVTVAAPVSITRQHVTTLVLYTHLEGWRQAVGLPHSLYHVNHALALLPAVPGWRREYVALHSQIHCLLKHISLSRAVSMTAALTVLARSQGYKPEWWILATPLNKAVVMGAREADEKLTHPLGITSGCGRALHSKCQG